MSELLDKRYLKHLSDRPGTPGICVVCIDRINKEAFTDTCAHSFCFACISRWSEVNAVCPLCKSKFKNIIHNVKGESLYDVHKVNKPTEDNQIFTLFQHIVSADSSTRRPTTSALTLWEPFAVPGNSTSLPTSSSRRFYSRIPRTQIYSLNLRPLESPAYRGRLRQVSPEFFRSNEAQIHRLIPWIIRDLEAIKAVSGFGFAVNEVSDIVLTTLPHQRIQGPHMRSLIQPFLARYASHFLRELYLFAISPLDIIGYDREVEYRSPDRAVTPRRLMMRFDINIDDSDNEVVEFAYRHDYPAATEIPSVTLSPTVQTVPEPVSIDDSEDDCVVISTITRNQNLSWDVVVISDSEDGTMEDTSGSSNTSVTNDRRSNRRETQAGTSGRITSSAGSSRQDRIIPSTERSWVERKRPAASKLRNGTMNGPSTSRAAVCENSDESGSDEDDRNWQVGKVRSYVTRKKQKTRRNLANYDTGSSSDESDENEGNWESSKMKSYLKRKKLKAKNDKKQNEATKRIRTKTPNKSKPIEVVPESTSSSSTQLDRPKNRLRSVVGKVINHRRDTMEPETSSRYAGLRKRKLTSYVYDSDSSD